MNIEKVSEIELLNKKDVRGEITIVGHDEIPFSITRLFYAHNVSSGADRGGHAHRVTEQFVIAIAGSFCLDLTDGRGKKSFELNNPHKGIYIPPMIWDRLYNFSENAVCLVLASTQYTESDYIRDWNEYLLAQGYSS